MKSSIPLPSRLTRMLLQLVLVFGVATSTVGAQLGAFVIANDKTNSAPAGSGCSISFYSHPDAVTTLYSYATAHTDGHLGASIIMDGKLSSPYRLEDGGARSRIVDEITITSPGQTGGGTLITRWHISGGITTSGLNNGRNASIYVENSVSGQSVPAPLNAGFVYIDQDIFLTNYFNFAEPFLFDAAMQFLLNCWFLGGEPAAEYHAVGNVANSLNYQGIAEVRGGSGAPVTDFGVSSVSGKDWKQAYQPDPSPVLDAAIATNGTLRVLGTFQGKSNETYTLSFEAPKQCPYPFPNQTTPLGERSITTDVTGHCGFEYVFPTNLSLPIWVRAIAIDSASNSSPPSACIPVTDAQLPVIVCPSAINQGSPDTNGMLVNFTVTATDNNPSNLTVVCTPPSGSVFPVGVATVQCTATDAAGNTAQCSFDVTVVVQPPVEWVSGSGDWNTAANWSTGVVPGPGDNVVIDRPGDLTITHSSGDHGVLSIRCKEAFTLSGGSLSVSSTALFSGNLDISGGRLAGSGDVTVTGTLNWNGPGIMSGSGKTIIAPTGVLNLNSADYLYLRRVLQNDGTANWTAGQLWMQYGTVNNNGSFTANSSASLPCFTDLGLSAFNNAGTFTKQGPGSTTFLLWGSPVQFNNSGTVNVQEGTLSLSAGGTNSAAIQVAAGATLTLAGSYTHTSTSSLVGTGTLNFNGGTHAFSAGAQITASVLNLTGGTVDFTEAKTFPLLTFSGGTLTGSGDVTVTGTLNWSGDGIMSGSGKTIIAPTGVLNLNSTDYLYLRRVLQNDGTANWTAGQLWMQYGTLNNNGSFTANSSGSLPCFTDVGLSAFNNAGTFIKQGAGSTTFLFWAPMPFNNSGTVNVQEGTLSLSAGGFFAFTATSVMQSQPGATLRLSGLNFGGATTNVSGYLPKGRLLFAGSGNQQLEVMSRDLGNVAAGYETNFAYGTLELSESVTVTLVDASDNSPGPEALYLDSLIVPAGTALNLSGLNVYVRSMQIAGTVSGGTIKLTLPELKLSAGTSTGLFTLTWPAGFSGYVLEFTENLTPPTNWQPVTSGITENGGIKSYTVTNALTIPGRLYRLRLQ